MAFSKIVLTFANWTTGDPTSSNVYFTVDGIGKSESSYLIRYGPGQFVFDSSSSILTAQNYKNAFQADFASTLFTVSVLSGVVTITATYDGAVFADFLYTGDETRVTAVITNEAFDPLFTILTAVVSAADDNKCTTVKINLTVENGTPPYTWNTILPGGSGLIGTVPRSGNTITLELEDNDAEIDTIDVLVPAILSIADITAINIEGDPSGLFGTVTIIMGATTGLPLVFEYSLGGITYQSSNIFTGILVGTHTIYILDQFGCVISQEFEVVLEAIRPPAYRLIPQSNSFGWMERQAAINNCTNPYNGTNAMPNNYKPTRWYNPKYFQPWCPLDLPITQFRSNYDTLTAKLVKIIDDSEIADLTIVQKSNNIGQRQNMDAKIYDRGTGQTGVWWDSGNTYENDLSTVNGTYDLDGQLPEWVKVGQKFTISGSAADGIYEIVQIIFDSVLLVNAAIIDRVYTDIAEETNVKVYAVYNRLNYEVYEFETDLSGVDVGCYKVVLSMTDSEDEYPDSIWDTFTFAVLPATEDIILIESWDHVDDGILYSTGIVHKQRFQGLFFENKFPSNFETSRDSRKALNKNDGRVQKSFIVEAIDIQSWVYEKLALFISKKRIRLNGVEVQFEEPWEDERQQQYTRVNLKGEAFVKGYEQYITNTYDIL